jgi:hypothetical protein
VSLFAKEEKNKEKRGITVYRMKPACFTTMHVGMIIHIFPATGLRHCNGVVNILLLADVKNACAGNETRRFQQVSENYRSAGAYSTNVMTHSCKTVLMKILNIPVLMC